MHANKLAVSIETVISIDTAKHILNSLHKSVSVGLRALKVACTVDDKLDLNLLDEHQLTSYELAFCEAEISAANCFLKSGSTLPFEPKTLPNRTVIKLVLEVLFIF